MDLERRVSQKAMLFSLYTLMVFTLANTMGSALVLQMGLPIRLLTSAGISTFMLLMLFYPAMWLIIGALVLTGGLAVNRFLPVYRIRIYEGVNGFLINIVQHIQGKEVIHPDNVFALWALLVGALSILTAIFILRKSSTWPLLLVYGLTLLIYWYSHIDLAYAMLMVFLILYLVLYSLKKYQLSQQGWTVEKADVQQDLYAPWQKTAVVYGLIIVLVAGFLPKSESFLEWPWLERKLVNHLPVLTELRGSLEHSRGFGASEYFSFASTGFQDNPQVLGGPVQLSDRLVMTVEAPESFYLRGNVKSLYQHNAWSNHQSNPKTLSIHMPLAPNMPDLTGGEEVTLTITYNNFSSATIFSPYQPIKVDNQRYERVSVDDNYQLAFAEGVFKNETYQIHALIPEPDQGYGLAPMETLPEHFLQLPNTIDASIQALTSSITRGHDSEYHRAIALQDYLRQNHTYSLEVPHTPPGREFVHYFLMDTKEGYCTYFATALAVMLRLEGIPSRYVEGYRMPQHSHDGIYEIRQKHAHAWVEAYIQGFGWVTLEPTPAYSAPEHQLHMERVQEASQNLSTEFDAFLMLLENMNMDNTLQIESDRIRKEAPATGDDGVEDPEVRSITGQRINRGIKWLFLSVSLVLLMRILWVQRQFVRYHKRLKKLETRQQVKMLYGNILHLLAMLDYPLEGGETPYEYSKRVSKYLYDMEHRFEKLTETYVLAEYSQVDIPADQALMMTEYLQYIDQRNRHKMGILRYMIAKYLRKGYFITRNS